MKLMWTLFVFLFSLTSTAQKVDFSSVDAFWPIAEKLADNQSPTAADWQQLFQTPAYHYLAEVEGKTDFLKNAFALIWQSEKAESLQAELEKGGYQTRILQHLGWVRDNRAKLDSFRTDLEQQDLLKNSLQRTAAYLPKGLIEKYPPPPIYFAFFEPDGKANGQQIVIDLGFAMQINLEGFIGHEAHHYYKGKINRLTLPPANAPAYHLLRAILQLQTEGIADLIDKRNILQEGDGDNAGLNWYARNYEKHYYDSPRIFAQMDSLLQRTVDEPKLLAAHGKKIWESLAFGAHPNGFYMAKRIEEELSKEVLIEHLDNPIAFVRLYNKASKKAKIGHIFSKKTMRVLKELEQKHLQ